MLPCCSPQDIHDQIGEVVRVLGAPEGGLMIYAEPSHDVPLENVEALYAAGEEFA